jgi:hypothetical protein
MSSFDMTHVANVPRWREACSLMLEAGSSKCRTFMDHDGHRTVLEQAHPEKPA